MTSTVPGHQHDLKYLIENKSALQNTTKDITNRDELFI